MGSTKEKVLHVHNVTKSSGIVNLSEGIFIKPEVIILYSIPIQKNSYIIILSDVGGGHLHLQWICTSNPYKENGQEGQYGIQDNDSIDGPALYVIIQVNALCNCTGQGKQDEDVRGRHGRSYSQS
jgi:hypothetical protein